MTSDMTDVNARIRWMPGMELSAETFKGLEEHWDWRQTTAIRTAIGGRRMGRVPGTEMRQEGAFVKNRFELTSLRCTALLSSGRVIDVDEDVEVAIPMLFGDRYYLTIAIGEEQRTFERKGVGFIGPQYEYAIQTIEEIQAADVFPIVRFRAADGVFSVDAGYIPPCLIMADDERFGAYLRKYASLMETLAAHQNLAEGEARMAMRRYLHRLKALDTGESVTGLVMLTEEIAEAIDYYIVAPVKGPMDIPRPLYEDIQAWLGWMEETMAGAAEILDGVVLEDNTIDYEALLAQAKAELYQRLHPELIEKLLADMKAELREEMRQQTETITNYINDTLKREMMQELTAEFNDRSDKLRESMTERIEEMGRQLNDSLYEKLYFNLFENLFNALYVPEPEELKFVPQI